MLSSKGPYKGSRRKLVLAFDIGTTFSGISYSILDPGQVPQIKPVTRFPAQENISGASKIPTIIYYDRAGKIRAVGAEAASDEVREAAEAEGWVKSEWFKLHLRSKRSKESESLLSKVMDYIPPLPLNKTVVEVFADFLEYLFKCASRYIQQSHANGEELWRSFANNIDFVLSHPNGWEGAEQSQMRQATILARLVPDTPGGRARVLFVTEGEASLHFALRNNMLSKDVKKGNGVVIVDAGGGTIDVSAYQQSRKGKQPFEEISAAKCHFHGSVFVAVHARVHISALLANSKFSGDVDHIVDCFDKTTKPRFRSSEGPQYIRFGSASDNELEYNIRLGQLKLEGSQVARFFQPSVTCIVNAVLDQKTALPKISHVVLVGGFAANDWLFDNVQRSLSKHGLKVLRPDNYTNKAASDGAVSFYLDHVVTTRVSKLTYGAFGSVPYSKSDPEHRQRLTTAYTNLQGTSWVPDRFTVILPKNTQVSEAKEFRKPFHNRGPSPWKDITLKIWAYRGDDKDPRWKDIDSENYTELCTVAADISHLPQPAKKGPTGDYYEVYYDIVLIFGLTELQIMVAWEEKGIEKRSSAQILYESELI